MPDFTLEQWTSFKEQFMSVIRFVMYAFDMFVDTCRSNPMLYMFLFFPIFIGAFFIVFDLITSLSRVNEGYSMSGNTSKFILGKDKSRFNNNASVNLAKANKSIDSKSAKVDKQDKAQTKTAARVGDSKNSSKVVKSAELRAGKVDRSEKTNLKAIDKVSGNSSKQNSGRSVSGKQSSPDFGDSGVTVSGVTKMIKKRYDENQKRKEREYEKAKAEWEKSQKEALKAQEKEDRDFHTNTIISYGDDGNGNLVVHRKKVNTRTGATISNNDTIYEKQKKSDD